MGRPSGGRAPRATGPGRGHRLGRRRGREGGAAPGRRVPEPGHCRPGAHGVPAAGDRETRASAPRNPRPNLAAAWAALALAVGERAIGASVRRGGRQRGAGDRDVRGRGEPERRGRACVAGSAFAGLETGAL